MDGTDRGLFRWNGEKITDEGVPPSLRHEQVSAMIRDRDRTSGWGQPMDWSAWVPTGPPLTDKLGIP